MNKNEKNLSGYGFSFKDYIRILENPDKIGLNNGIWSAPILKGYDKNQRGYGIDINTNKKAKALTNNRPGRWLTEKEADTLMDDHINYITEAANKHIKGFSELPFRRKWALLGMLYRGDSVNKSGININEPNDLKFFKSISDYYRSKGLNTRANSSDEFFNRPVSKLLSMFKLKNGGLVRKMQTAAGGGLVYDDGKNIERTNYNNWSKLSFVDKMKRRFNIAKHLFNESSSPIINSVGAIFGEYDPENPDLNTGVVYAPSRGINPKTVLNVAKGVRTLEDYLKTTKVSAPILEGSSMARNSYATDRFIGGKMFLNTLPEEAMKILGHGMAKSPTILDALARLRYILDNGIKGKFYTAPLKVSKEAAMAGEAIGTGGATPYFDGHFLITGKPGQMINSVDDIGTIYINDAYENEEALKAALKLLQYLLLTYPKINFKLYSLGFKQGGKMNTIEFLKNGSGIHINKKNRGKFTSYCGGKVTDECIRRAKASGNPTLVKRATFALNARRWKHKEGGKAFITGVSVLDSNPKAYKYVKKKYRMALLGTKLNFFLKAGNWLNNNGDLVKSVANAGLGILSSILLNKAIDSQIEANKKLMEVNKQKAFMENYKKALGLQTDRSDIINMNRAWLMANNLDYSDNEELMEENALLEGSRNNGLLDSLGGLASSILNNPNLLKKSNTGVYNLNTDVGNTTYNWKTNTFNNKNKVGTINSDGSMNTGIGGTTYNWNTNTFGSNNIMNSFDKIKF